MKNIYSSQTYESASLELDKACLWLESLGINYSKTRLTKYKTLFSDLAEYQSNNELEKFYEKYKFEYWVNAAHEVAELIRIYGGLGRLSDDSLISRLKNSLSGHELYVMDTQNRSGRDFIFELSVASKFHKSGYSVNFGHEADLQLEMNGFTFYVECKRLKSLRQAQKRVKEGLKQLHRRYTKSSNPELTRGLLCVSIGKAINPSLGLLEADDPESLANKAFSHNAAFIERYKSYWGSSSLDKRTLGVVIILDVPGIIKSKNQLITCHEVTLNNCISTNSPDYKLLDHIANKILR